MIAVWRAGALALTSLVLLAAPAAALMPITGPPTPAGLERWDRAAEQVMHEQGIPGATLAVAYQGRVVLEHGYGYADTATKEPVEPDAAFRLASVTKTLTGAAILTLVRQHRLTLGTRPFVTILRKLRGPHGAKPVDPRVRDITIEELLAHKAGWDIDKIGFDPALSPSVEERPLGLHHAPTCEQAISFMLGRRLNTKPGTHTSYSNLGYCVLGDVLAHVEKTTYANAIAKLITGPLGMKHTTVSKTSLTARLPGEVHYYGQGGDSGSQDPYRLPLVGAFGAAGEVSTAPDLSRFVIAASGEVPGSKPWPGTPAVSTGYWGVQPPPFDGVEWEFDGSLPGTTTSLGILGPVSYVFLGNSRNPKLDSDNKPFFDAAGAATTWPAGNLLVPPAL